MWLLWLEGRVLPDEIAHKCTGHASPGGQERERGPLPEAMGQVALAASWPMERTGHSTVQVQVMSQ